jgi:hypothetical protein
MSSTVHSAPIPNRVHNSVVTAMTTLQNKYKQGAVTGEELQGFLQFFFKELDGCGRSAVIVNEEVFIQDFNKAFAETMAHENAWNALHIVVNRAFGINTEVRRHFAAPASPGKPAKGKPGFKHSIKHAAIKPKAKAKGAAA